MVSKAGAGPQREKIALWAWLKTTALAVLGARAAAGSQGMGPENESRSGHHRLALYPQTGTLELGLQKEPDYAVRDLGSISERSHWMDPALKLKLDGFELRDHPLLRSDLPYGEGSPICGVAEDGLLTCERSRASANFAGSSIKR
jgi:hypothetical protein